jgi:predicted PurR-regulated permease PerM
MKKFRLSSVLVIGSFIALITVVAVLFVSNQQLQQQNDKISVQLSSVIKLLNKVEQSSVETTRRIEAIEQQLKPDLHNLLAKR